MDFQPWILDAVLALILLVSCLGGILRGLLRSISWLPGIVFGVLAVKFFSVTLAEIIKENSVLSPLWSTYISVIALMGGVYLIVRLLASVFSSFLDESRFHFMLPAFAYMPENVVSPASFSISLRSDSIMSAYI